MQKSYEELTLSTKKNIQCRVLDGTYEEEDFQLLIKLTIIKPSTFNITYWDGFEWSLNGCNRVYTNINKQHEYDEFLKRLNSLETSGIIYEISEELEEDQTYYFEKERIYLYVESKEQTD